MFCCFQFNDLCDQNCCDQSTWLPSLLSNGMLYERGTENDIYINIFFCYIFSTQSMGIREDDDVPSFAGAGSK